MQKAMTDPVQQLLCEDSIVSHLRHLKLSVNLGTFSKNRLVSYVYFYDLNGYLLRQEQALLMCSPGTAGCYHIYGNLVISIADLKVYLALMSCQTTCAQIPALSLRLVVKSLTTSRTHIQKVNCTV